MPKCMYCDKEMVLPPFVKGNPKVAHWDCAYKACAESREKIAHQNQALRAAAKLVSGFEKSGVDKSES